MLVLYRRHAIMLSVVLALGWLLGAVVVLVLGWLSGAVVVALPLELSAPPLQEAPEPHLPALALEIVDDTVVERPMNGYEKGGIL